MVHEISSHFFSDFLVFAKKDTLVISRAHPYWLSRPRTSSPVHGSFSRPHRNRRSHPIRRTTGDDASVNLNSVLISYSNDIISCPALDIGDVQSYGIDGAASAGGEGVRLMPTHRAAPALVNASTPVSLPHRRPRPSARTTVIASITAFLESAGSRAPSPSSSLRPPL
jgi:hypothetical protein